MARACWGQGDISLFTFPHFHTMVVYFSGSEHAKRSTQTDNGMQRYRSSRPFSFPSTIRWDQVCLRACSRCAPGGVARNCLEQHLKHLKSDLEKLRIN